MLALVASLFTLSGISAALSADISSAAASLGRPIQAHQSAPPPSTESWRPWVDIGDPNSSPCPQLRGDASQRCGSPALPSNIGVDEDAALRASKFPIPPDELINLAKFFLVKNLWNITVPDLIADDFVFTGPFVGPLTKWELAAALDGFQLMAAFPDLRTNVYNFRVDPLEPNKVWYFSRAVGTHIGTLRLSQLSFIGNARPTGKTVRVSPQCCSLTFNEDGKVTKWTIGYVIDKTAGDTGTLGGILAFLYGIGKPFPGPEGKPWKPSFKYKLLMRLAAMQKQKQQQQKNK
ncbi:unnamed protein product [Vitrella brassicaformis CCMP3155]|uniref:SnoaL-like domain-containing protein n=2 Tax=Vitrella brassicaformis TaxID=1169539 RepID=A0A0G4ENL1_VITBC|nr:unnamed protein product [Vitrella brassicaformis CCMP3155]|eukprot:CEL99188.1 unnamed protein product [Vitrella brassicaformis CCMP3155]